MCYFDTAQFTCGCWKWDKFRKQCDREWRMGETCGLKIFNNVHHLEGVCTTCEKLKRKENRYAKTMSDYNRWKDDPKLQASAEKAAKEARQIWSEMEELKRERERKYMNIGSNRKTQLNGQANGQVNGHANGSGFTNGHGHTNAYANGYTNGHTNGHTNGYMNGQVNGNGVMNGH